MSAIKFAEGPSMVNVRCRCGHEADYMDFRTTKVSGELPQDQMQCPSCNRAWKIQRGRPRVGWSGMIVPGETQVVETEAVL